MFAFFVFAASQTAQQAPNIGQKRHGPRGFQESPMTAQEGPKSAQEAPKTAPVSPKRAPREA